jgi:hypothetical protein
MNQITRHKLLTLAFGCLLLLTMMFVGNCSAQSIQYQIERVCINQSCKECKGYIAISKENLYIKVDSVMNHFEIKKTIDYRGLKSYQLLNVIGRFEICNDVAYIEVFSIGCRWKSEMYYLKKEL